MGDMDSTNSIEVQASVLAEKTVRISLEDLAQLCPEAEQIIEGLLALQQVSSDVLLTLGLENQRELRAFVERVILKTSHSPQDLLAGYLHQGRAARKAGIDPREWNLRVHRPIRLVSARVLHCLADQKEPPATLRAVYGLNFDCMSKGLAELAAQLHDAPEAPAATGETDDLQQQIQAKLTLVPRIEFLLRKGAAMRLMREALKNQDGSGLDGIEELEKAPNHRKAGVTTAGSAGWGHQKVPRIGRIALPLRHIPHTHGSSC
jgi:hypothetical protein